MRQRGTNSDKMPFRRRRRRRRLHRFPLLLVVAVSLGFLCDHLAHSFSSVPPPIRQRPAVPLRQTTTPPPRFALYIASSETHHQTSAHDRDRCMLLQNLLDRAVLLHHDTLLSRHASSFSWMTEQLASLVVYLGRRLHHDTRNSDDDDDNHNPAASRDASPPSSQALAIQLEEAVARDASLSIVQAIATDFRQALLLQQQKSNELETVSHQLDAFESLLLTSRLSLSSSTCKTTIFTPSSTWSKPPRVDHKEAAVGTGHSATHVGATSTTIVADPPVVVLEDDMEQQQQQPTTNIAASQQEATTRINSIKRSVDQEETNAPSSSRRTTSTTGLGKEEKSPTTVTTTPLSTAGTVTQQEKHAPIQDEEEVDIAIVGAGLAGLCAGAILNTRYGKKVGIYESHYLAGGCAHAFDRKASNGVTFTFDSGPSILLGCSSPPYNALQQVLETVGQPVEWIPYDGWGMIENPGQKDKELRWKVQLGPDHFQEGPLATFGGPKALEEFNTLRDKTKGLLAGASIPAMAMRAGSSALVPLLRYFPTLVDLISQGETLTGTFAPFMDGPLYTVTDPWFRNWLDALAFSLSGLPASRTAAAAMAFVLNDMHRPGAALDYPKGGMGAIIDALVRGVEQGDCGSVVHLKSHVASIDGSKNARRITGLTLANGKRVKAREGVICNAPVWTLNSLIQDERIKATLNNALRPTARQPNMSWDTNGKSRSSIRLERPAEFGDDKETLLAKCDTAEMTGSFLHLHLALDAKGLDLDALEAHYTVMDRSLAGDGSTTVLQEEDGGGVTVLDGPCGELNMIAVSNPCKLDASLAPEGYIVMHAYGAGNEPFGLWKDLDPKSAAYKALKEERAQVLWRAVESVIPDVRQRVVLKMIGSPLTHQRFLRRPQGTYGSATEDYLPDGSTPYSTLMLASDGIFPGIGVPSTAIAGASAANSMVRVMKQWQCLDALKKERKL